jgi:hypothetical protein
MMRLALAPKSILGIEENSSNREAKNWIKIPLKITKMKNIETQDMR